MEFEAARGFGEERVFGRSPWTLASDAVWERTHRLAGWWFMLAGLLVVVLTLVAAAVADTRAARRGRIDLLAGASTSDFSATR